MPKINVYLPDKLASAVKEAGVPVSAVCQAALSDAVERVGQTRRVITFLRDDSTSAAVFGRLATGLQAKMTPRLVTALRVAGASVDGETRTGISSLDLLRGVLDDGENLAVRLLLALDIDVDRLRELSVTSTASEPTAPTTEPGETIFARMTVPARSSCASALEAVLELGHNYVGCEHLLIGLAASEGRAAELLNEHGVRIEAVHQALNGAVAGAVHERRAFATRDSGALDELVRRIEAIERQLAGNATA